jgi:hypothetical protein
LPLPSRAEHRDRPCHGRPPSNQQLSAILLETNSIEPDPGRKQRVERIIARA